MRVRYSSRSCFLTANFFQQSLYMSSYREDEMTYLQGLT